MANKKDERDIEKDLIDIQNDIDFLYDLLQPQVPSFGRADFELDYKVTVEMTDEIYKEIFKYSENKKFIFIGVA
tara:strand:- start:789 stop:1010 length:222 start_codon:yes stop_codon:yes gene_type:complete